MMVYRSVPNEEATAAVSSLFIITHTFFFLLLRRRVSDIVNKIRGLEKKTEHSV